MVHAWSSIGSSVRWPVVSDLSSFMGLSAFLWVGWFHEREFGDEPIDDDAGLPRRVGEFGHFLFLSLLSLKSNAMPLSCR